MDSVKVFKGYGKVEDKQHYNHHLEDQQQQQQQQRRHKISTFLIATTSTISILFFTLTLAFALVTLFHHTTNTESQQNPLNSAESIRAVCNVTRFPESCLAAVSSSSAGQNPTTDPESILRLSLHASTDELAKLASSLGAMASNNPKGHALSDCQEQIGDALSRLNDSLSAMSAVPDGDVTLTDAKINDIQTWVSAAVTEQQTCVDGLEEAGFESVAVTKVKSMMQKSSEYTSNSLAIVANLRTLLHQFHMSLH